MQQPYANRGNMPRQPQMGYALPPPAPSGGSSAIVWVIAGVVLLCVVGAAIYFSMKSPSTQAPAGPSAADIVAEIQSQTAASTPTPTPETLPPLCPENVAPVLDADGKIYKNICYAQSVNAKGPLVPSPVGQPGGIPGAVGTDTSLSTSAPVIYQGKGGQSVGGITQGRAPTLTRPPAQRSAAGPSGAKYLYPEGKTVGTPVYANPIGRV